MAERRRLPNRRGSLTFDVECRGLRSAWRFADGRLGKLFIVNHKAGSSAGIVASDGGSLALQFGCPADVLARALSRDRTGHAAGPLGLALDLILGVGER